MYTIINAILFVVITIWLFKFVKKGETELYPPFDKEYKIPATWHEGLIVAISATAWFGLGIFLSARLFSLEVIALICLINSKNRVILSSPLKLYAVFLIWGIIGLLYTPELEFGFRMIIKYFYPFLLALLCSSVMRSGRVMILAGEWARVVGTAACVIGIIPIINKIIGPSLWYIAARLTGVICMVIFSFALALFTADKRKNLIWGFLLMLPAFMVTFRTDIFGLAVALAGFFFIKYRIKSLPIIGAIGILGICAVFYIPGIRQKMFLNPDKANIEDYFKGNINTDNIQTNYREFMWTDATAKFFRGHETIGSGTGRVQKFFYTEAQDARKGGQLHNDFLVIMCDNGMIGLLLYGLACIGAFAHCVRLYKDDPSPYVRLAAITAGASLLGITCTMYSDNTVSYSMVTLAFPWSFYGMALGLKQNEEEG